MLPLVNASVHLGSMLVVRADRVGSNSGQTPVVMWVLKLGTRAKELLQ